jgi:hypothetical protein
MLTSIAAGRGHLPDTDEWRTRALTNTSFKPEDGGGNSVMPPGAIGGVLNGTYHKQSPLGMELGEFMLDGDLDFLSGQLFEYNTGVGGI